MFPKKSKFKIVDVTGDGSCFFRALYLVLKQKNGIPRLIKNYQENNLHVEGEEEFVSMMRILLAKLIVEKKDWGIIHDVYQNLKHLDKRDYTSILKTSFPSWFVAMFRTLPKTEQVFRNKFANGILSKSNWVSEIEVTIVAKMLQETKFYLHIFTGKSLPNKRFAFAPKGLYLLNLNEVHYNAIIPDLSSNKVCMEGKILNPVTYRCVLQTSCKGYEVFYNNNMKKRTTQLC